MAGGFGSGEPGWVEGVAPRSCHPTTMENVMTEEERNQKEKEMLDSMRRAQANMQAVLYRVSRLEEALKAAARNLDSAAEYISEHVYLYNSTNNVKSRVKKDAEKARSLL